MSSVEYRKGILIEPGEVGELSYEIRIEINVD